jgi:hypothetical protein
MKLTLKLRIKYIWNILTYIEKHNHPTQVKGLKLFCEGYNCGFSDGKENN